MNNKSNYAQSVCGGMEEEIPESRGNFRVTSDTVEAGAKKFHRFLLLLRLLSSSLPSS